MASQFSRVAKMGSKSSKYGEQRAAYFDKGEQVTVSGERGTVVKCGRGFVVVEINGVQTAYNPRYVDSVIA